MRAPSVVLAAMAALAPTAAGCGDEFAGDSADGAAACAPADIAGFTPPPYRPARVMVGACTPGQVPQFYDCMMGSAPCEPFLPGGTLETCGACLSPSDFSDPTHGPVLSLGNTPGSGTAVEANLAGCVEVTTDVVACAEAYQARAACVRAACDANCPNESAATLAAREECYRDASDTVCSAYSSAAPCSGLSAATAACAGPSFQDQFVAAGTALCVTG